MSKQFRRDGVGEFEPLGGSLSESEIHGEHQAALDATLFRPERDASELVLELEAGELRVRRRF